MLEPTDRGAAMAITRHWWVERDVGLAHVRGEEEVMKLAKAPDRAVLNLHLWYAGPVPSVSKWKLCI